MSDIVKHEPSAVSADTLAHVLGTGDISKLTTPQRVEYLVATCRSLGLNPLTRPFRFLALNGTIQLYATKDCTDQLRTVHGITLHLVDKTLEEDLYIVTARARNAAGREDEDVGAVSLPRAGESRANAIMKATTKAKRRVTLSICGLGGMPDESELDSMPGATTFDAEDEPPVAKTTLKAVAAIVTRPARKTETDEKPTRTDEQWRVWIEKLRAACSVLYRRAEVVEIGDRPSVGDAIANGPAWVQREVSAILADNYKRFPEEPGDEPLDDLEIAGGDKLAAG